MGPYGRKLINDFLVTFDEPRKRVILRNDRHNPNIVYVIPYEKLREMSEAPRGLFQERPLRVRLRDMWVARHRSYYMLDVRENKQELAPFAKRGPGIGRLPLEEM